MVCDNFFFLLQLRHMDGLLTASILGAFVAHGVEGPRCVAIVDCDSATCVHITPDSHTPPLLTSSEAVTCALVLRDAAKVALSDKGQSGTGYFGDTSDGAHTGSERSFGSFSVGGSSSRNWRPIVSIDVSIETDRRTFTCVLRPPQVQGTPGESDAMSRMLPATIMSTPTAK
jgi:hypothetical protein